MTFAAGSYHGVRYCAESSFGVSDVTALATTKDLRHTSCSLVLSKDSFLSNEIRDDRQISDFRHGMKKVAGDIGFEFSHGEYDPIIAAALFSAWSGSSIVAGVTPYSFQIERAFTDIGQYGKFNGCMVNSFSLSIPANAMVTGTANILGIDASYTAAPMYATPAASKTGVPFDSFSGAILEGGTTIAIVTSIDINIANGITPTQVVGDDNSPQLIPGRSNVTGTVSAYFSDLVMLNKFINETESTIRITLGVTPYYIIELPKIKYSGADNPVSGEGPVMLNMPFQALYSGVTTNIMFTRS